MGHSHDHPREHGPDSTAGPARPPAAPETPETPLDPGSQALAAALKSSFSIVKVVMVGLVLLFLGSGFFTVGPQERAIVLRFGKPLGEGEDALLGPGPHFALPYPIDEVVRVPITELQRATSTVGWFAVTPEQEIAGVDPAPGPSLNPAADGYVLTADHNIVHARATMNYRIEDPVAFVFNFTAASNAVINALNTALVQSAARFPVDDILARDVFGFKDAVRRRVSELAAMNRLGVVVEQVEVETRPPLFLRNEFARVTDAAQKRERVINEARTIENQVLSRAGADAAGLIDGAASESVRRVESLKAEAARFNDLLPKHLENPRLFVELRLAETIGRVMAGAQDKIFLSAGPDGRERELRLLLNREPQPVRRESPAP